MAKKLNIKVGSLVAFNELPDATWFEVLEVDRDYIKIREYHESIKYKPQDFYTSLVKQVKEK